MSTKIGMPLWCKTATAEANGALYKGKKAGNLGDIAGFSLQSSKNLMAGEGGIITT
ncbi:unnamed protein product, partial [marine sediment metagenome]